MKKMKRIVVTMFAFALMMSFGFTSDAAPAKVTGVTQTKGNDYSATIIWAPVGGTDVYYIQKCVDGVTWEDVDWEYSTEDKITSLTAGQAVQVRVRAAGEYNTPSTYGPWSDPITVYAAPAKVTAPIQTAAAVNSVTLGWAAVPGVNEYTILAGDAVIGTTNTNSITIGNLQAATDYNNFKILTTIVLPTGVPLTSGWTTSFDTVKTMPAPYTVDQFGIDNVYSSLKKASFIGAMAGSIDGYEIEGTSVKGSKTFSVVGTSSWGTDTILLASNNMYKYRARPFITLNGVNVYADWSPYRYFGIQGFSANSSKKKIKVGWKKIKGATDCVISISSVSKDTGYKKVKTVKPKKGTLTISKCGKKSLKASKYYYVRIVPRVKIGKKKVSSDIFTYVSEYVTKY